MPKTLFFTNHRIGPHPHHPFPRGMAFLAHGSVWFSGVHHGGSIQSAPFTGDLAALKGWIFSAFGDPDPIESDYEPGTAYKRIAWPFQTIGSLTKVIDATARTQSLVALRLLMAKMESIFEYVEPSPLNLGTYGHNVRELLLLASMEVEASWAAVLKANGYVRNRYSTNDYVKLLEAMLLDSYSVTLASYPSFPVIAPFVGWSASNPTSSLDWYDAYNATKHNREEHLNAATLQRAVTAVGAVVVMFYAQFGFQGSGMDQSLGFVRQVFNLGFDGDKHPFYYYIQNVAGFSSSGPWDLILLDYPLP